MSSRREKLEALLAQQPNDAFLRYALALELDKAGETPRSQQLFQSLMRDTPPYVPAYFMAGQALARLNRIEQARGVLRDGIEAARVQGNAHAAGEMSEFLASLGAAGEDDKVQ